MRWDSYKTKNIVFKVTVYFTEIQIIKNVYGIYSRLCVVVTVILPPRDLSIICVEDSLKSISSCNISVTSFAQFIGVCSGLKTQS
jgi:hypothetical protein